MMPLEEARDELKHLLARCEQWLRTVDEVSELLPDALDLQRDVERMEALRTRALSTMLKVALLGRQSSGKSFLISGLQGGLEYLPFIDEDGEPSDEYRGILPSSASPTTACPSTVIPVGDDPSVDAGGRGLLRVKFKGKPDWVEIGTDLHRAEVAAYAADDGNKTDRRSEHVNEHVERIELLISKARLPIKLFDLPGSESEDEERDEIMYEAWKEADCFVYVSQATEALTANELRLIRDLYAHAVPAKKRVLWVLSGIDRAAQREHGQAAWKGVLAKNDQYLQERYPRSEGFIGRGFLPVSAALEAKAEHEEANGRDGSTLRRRSRMGDLRERLQELLESGAGHKHLKLIGDEAGWVVRDRRRTLADLLDAHRMTVDKLEVERDLLRAQLEGMDASLARMRAELNDELDRRIRKAQRPFGGLSDELHRGLDALIDAGNLSAEHVNEVGVRHVQIFNEWMTAPQGPGTLWEHERAALDESARLFLGSEFGEETGSQLVGPEPLDLDAISLQSDGDNPWRAYGMFQAAANTLGVASPLAGGAVWLTTSLSLATIAVPVGAAILAAIGIARITDVLKERESKIQQARQERKEMIDEQTKEARAGFEEMVRNDGRRVIDAAEEYHHRHRSRLRATLEEIVQRINADDTARSREIVARLTPVEERGQAIATDIQDLLDRNRTD
ncbi:dynamin family protein [Streptomyces sp. R28]|uniref:Dynamin family protein n=1 Tax=Streptomyces sp. R28 TaxID=3238628 RepID=A0AB39PU41_9ACTN